MAFKRSIKINLLVAAVLFSACATPPPVHNPKKGFFDHLADMQEKASVDTHDHEAVAEEGQDLAESEIPEKVDIHRYDSVDLSWPLDNPEVTSPFGPRGRRFHDGLDLRANVGTPVYAAHDGKVIYSGRKVGGYGRVVVIKHDTGLTSIYAHNSKLLVKSGATVKRGQKIAYSGRSGRVRGPHVHFELRDGILAFNPAQLLGQAPMAYRSEDMHETGPIGEDEPLEVVKKPKQKKVASTKKSASN